MKIEFKDIPYFSKLFVDFVKKDEKLNQFFPSNFCEDKNELFELRLSQTNQHRYLYQNLLKVSNNFEFTNLQKENFSKASDNKTLFVISGQQPGILGGPLYSIYKAFSAISYSQELKNKYPQYNFVPIFWVEDGDDDIDEVNKYTYIDSNGAVGIYKLDNIKKRKLSYFEFNQSINNILNTLSNNIEQGNELSNFLNQICDKYKLLNDNFIHSINFFTSDYGLLFIKSSEVYRHKVYNNIIKDDLLNPSKIAEIIDINNKQLLENQYSIQASTSDINFFCSRGDIRHKITIKDNSYIIDSQNLNQDELIDLIDKSGDIFTPKVLLRPIIQDFIFPTAAYIGGPGEIAYLAQVSKLYEHFDLNMPLVISRHSFTIINNSVARTIEKENINLEFLLRNIKQIEKELAEEAMGEELESKFENIESEIEELYNGISTDILGIDKGLVTNIDLTVNKSKELLNNLKKKVISQLKKKNETRFNRIQRGNVFIFPNNNLQERELNIFNLINNDNYKDFIHKLLELTKEDSSSHYIINI